MIRSKCEMVRPFIRDFPLRLKQLNDRTFGLGIEITDDLAEEGPKNFFKYNYLNDQVTHYRLQGAGHGFGSMGRDADQIIKDFIELN